MAFASCRSFCRQFLLWSLLPVLSVVLVNAAVDPLHLLSFPGWKGWTLNKPALRDQERLFKPYAVVRQRPQVVFLGSSRSNYALDPLHPAFSGLRTYNLSLSGTNMTEIRQMFEHALAQGALQQVVVELDIGFFSPSAQGSDGTLDCIDTAAGRHPARRALRTLQTAAAWDTLALSIQTLRGQRAPWEYTEAGRQGDAVFEARIAAYGGIRNTIEGYMERLLPAERQLAAYWNASGAAPDALPGMDDLRTLLRLAQEHGVHVSLYFSPVHAIDASAARRVFGAGRIDAWRAAILQLTEQLREQSGGTFEVPVWDFSGFNSVTTEPLPAASDPAARMRNYWDQSHYRAGVGNWILDRLSGHADSAAPVPADFGVRLTAQDLAGHFASERSAAENYAAMHPDVTDFLARLTHGSHHQSNDQ